VVYILLLLSPLVGATNVYCEERFSRVGQETLEVSLWKQGGGDSKKFGIHGQGVLFEEICGQFNFLVEHIQN
jgi:hypothetical protein